MAKYIFIVEDCTSKIPVAAVVSRNGKTALEKFARQLVEPGKREFFKPSGAEGADGWYLRMQSGAQFVARLEFATSKTGLTDGGVIREYLLHVPASMRRISWPKERVLNA